MINCTFKPLSTLRYVWGKDITARQNTVTPASVLTSGKNQQCQVYVTTIQNLCLGLLFLHSLCNVHRGTKGILLFFRKTRTLQSRGVVTLFHLFIIAIYGRNCFDMQH